MLRNRPDLAALGFCALVVVCVSVLAYGRVPIPDFLPMIGLVVAGAGAGVALNDTSRETLPRASSTSSTSSTSRRTPAAPAPRSAPQHYTGPVPAAPVGSPYDQDQP